MKLRAIWIALMIALAVMPACANRNGEVKLGSTQTERIDVANPATAGPYHLEVAMGAGTLKLNPGAGDRLVQGTVTYNVDELKPNVTTSGSTVRVEQGRLTLRSLPTNIKNEWDLQLGDAPTSLKVSAGAAKGNLELGGLSLTGMNVSQGASDFTLSFTKPNLVPMDSIQFNAGAAKSVIRGLGNTDAASMEFKGGAGQLDLGFDGRLQRDLRVTISAAAGQVVIDVPSGTPATVTLKGVLAKVNASGGWSGSGNTYQLGGSGPSITINMNVSVGQVQLRSS